jgi:pimeloyl-ACP methyl ester carboxylesterase/predicted glycosyltransferase
LRALSPLREGVVESAGVPIAWELYGDGDRTVMFLPPWQIVPSRVWKMQLAYFARYFRVLTFDARGTGRSGRPAKGYDQDTCAADALAVLDATETARASLVCFSRSCWQGAILAAEHPERVEHLVLTATALDDAPRVVGRFHDALERHEGWEKFNAHYWRTNYEDFLRFFFGEVFPEPHSTKPIDDGVGWGLETTPEILIETVEDWRCKTPLAELYSRVKAPTLIVHGSQDGIRALALSEHAHESIAGSHLMVFQGSGHAPQVRDPVRYNVSVRDFLRPAPPSRTRWSRPRARPRRALFISSPIGLGHALRDLAIARELRALRPGLEIDWLAQSPVTTALEAGGERIHPASRLLAGESAHMESEAGEHDLRVFQAWRTMDEILLANYMTVHDVLEAEPYDVVIGDEAWETDHYLHENPELKRAPFVWLTDFVGWLPMNGEREARLTSDYNAEMIEHVARHPRVRDVALFVGDPEDVVDLPFGPGLPRIGDWTRAHYDFPGYILPFDPAEFADREAVRAAVGFRPGQPVVFAAVGGTGVGQPLLRKVVAAYPHARRLVPDLRMIVVTGPRIDPASLPTVDGLEYRGYVPDLYAHLAACDLAVVQGGLSTCMELTATRRPFLYFPLRNHFEQNIHVPHRLARYRAGTRMDYHETTPEALADAVADGLKRPVLSHEVKGGGARRAAERIARLL